MRKYRWLIVLASVAALFLILIVVNKWLVAKGQSLTFHMGANLKRPEFVQVNWPVKLDVVYHVSGMKKGSNVYAWDVQCDFTLRNDYNKDVRVHLPLLRAGLWFPSSTEFIFNSQLRSEWKQSRTITLKPGESFSISLPKAGLDTGEDIFNGKESKEYGRWALVFGVPDGEDSDKYLVGTVLSNPIEWRNEIQDKSKK